MSISGLVLWLDPTYGAYQEITGASATTPAIANNDPVGTWKAKTGQYFTSPANGQRPLFKTAIKNGRAILRFDGVDDHLQATTFIVANQPDTAIAVFDTGRIFDGQGGTARQLFLQGTSGAIGIHAGLALSTVINVAAGTFRLVSGKFNGASSTVRINGVQQVSGDAGASALNSPFYINTDNISHFGGDLGEFLIYSPSPSASDTGKIEAYLNSKWAIY
jgi:hypothetical protein